MAASKMAGWTLKCLYLSYYSNQKGYFRFYSLIDAMYSAKLPSVIFVTNPRWRHAIWRHPKWRPFVVLRPCTTLSSQLHSTTILEGNRDHFRFTSGQPLRIHFPDGRRLPNVYAFATICDWYTDGWHIT